MREKTIEHEVARCPKCWRKVRAVAFTGPGGAVRLGPPHFCEKHGPVYGVAGVRREQKA